MWWCDHTIHTSYETSYETWYSKFPLTNLNSRSIFALFKQFFSRMKCNLYNYFYQNRKLNEKTFPWAIFLFVQNTLPASSRESVSLSSNNFPIAFRRLFNGVSISRNYRRLTLRQSRPLISEHAWNWGESVGFGALFYALFGTQCARRENAERQGGFCRGSRKPERNDHENARLFGIDVARMVSGSMLNFSELAYEYRGRALANTCSRNWIKSLERA